MGTTGHPVGYWEVDTTEKIRDWLIREYSWSEWTVIDLAQDSKTRSDWWIIMRQPESGKTRAMVVHTQNRAKREGFFYTKEVGEDMGPYSTGIPKRLFKQLTPLEESDSPYAREWRDRVINETVRR